MRVLHMYYELCVCAYVEGSYNTDWVALHIYSMLRF